MVRDIFGWYAEENLSLVQIATRLNARGVAAPAGAVWHPEPAARGTRRRSHSLSADLATR